MDKILNYELFTVPPRWLFLRVETEDGLVGWGEPIVEGRAKTTATAVAELMDKYVMKTSKKIEIVMYKYPKWNRLKKVNR